MNKKKIARKKPTTKAPPKPALFTPEDRAELKEKVASRFPGTFAEAQGQPTFSLTEIASAFGSNFSAEEPYTPFSFAREAIDDARRGLTVFYCALAAEDPENPIVDALHNMNCRLELAGNVLAKFYRAEPSKAEVQS